MPKPADIETKYAIKISKGYPLKHSLKLHILDGGLVPKIFDNRNYFQDVMAKPFDYSVHIIDIFRKVVDFDQSLHHIN